MNFLTIRREAIAGITTFFAMAYIVIVNPAILATEGTGMSFSGVLTATVLLSFSMTLLMGLYARLPFAVAPGMGINAFFTFSMVLGQQIPWPIALGIVFWSGIIFLLVSVTPIREAIAEAIPHNLRIAAGAGIGLFLIFIGLKNSGIVIANESTLVSFGGFTGNTLLASLGLIIIVGLLIRKSTVAMLAGIAIITAISFALGKIKIDGSWISAPDFSSVFLAFDPLGAFRIEYLPMMIALLFTDLFDSISTFVGVSHAAGLVDENNRPKNLREGLIVDSFATFLAGVFGTSSGTAYIESAAGIESGGKTGLTSVFTALCFLPCLFLAPLAGAVPSCATAPVLMVVGALMFRSISSLKIERHEDLFPTIATMAIIPLTFSITQGIICGFIAHTALYLMAGRYREIKPTMYIVTVLSIVLLMVIHYR